MLVIIPEAMEAAMKRDLDKIRDSLPKDEHEVFEAERHIHRQNIINHVGEFGGYPTVKLDGINTNDNK